MLINSEMKLFLTGGGESENFEELDNLFISKLSKNPKLLFIPLAGEESSFLDGLDRIQETFSTIHFNKIELCTNLFELDWEELKRFDAIYLDGGNTFHLMKQIRQSHFYELIRKFIQNGGVINGDSAGAIILGSHLETAHFGILGDENESNLISYQGLNLLGDWAIHCHYDPEDDEEIMSFSREYGLPVLALAEETGVFIEYDHVQVYGDKELKIFDYSSDQEDLMPLVLKPGDKLNLKLISKV